MSLVLGKDLCLNCSQISHAMVMCSEVLHQNSGDIVNTECLCSDHFLNIRPIPAAIEEGLEDSEIVTAQEWQHLAQ